MAFDLRIRFIGLCLFVPDRPLAPTRIDVLLPQWDNHDGGHGGMPGGGSTGAGAPWSAHDAHHEHEHEHEHEHHDPHIAALVWNTAFDSRCSTVLAPTCCEHQMSGTQLDLNLLTATALQRPPADIVNLGAVDGLRIARAHLGRHPVQPPVLARIALPAGSGTAGTSTLWQFGGGMHPFTWWLDWRIPAVESDALALTLTGPDGAVVQKTLHPLVRSRTLDLTIYNVPRSELHGHPIPRPASGSSAHHLMAHFALGTHTSTELPQYVSGVADLITPCIGAPAPGPRGRDEVGGDIVPIPAGMNPYSCLLSEALPEEGEPAPDPDVPPG